MFQFRFRRVALLRSNCLKVPFSLLLKKVLSGMWLAHTFHARLCSYCRKDYRAESTLMRVLYRDGVLFYIGFDSSSG